VIVTDDHQILNIHLYVPMNWDKASTKWGDKVSQGEHNRLYKFYRHPDIQLLVNSEAEAEAGRMVVSGKCCWVN
jgi:hypothetical protein